MIRLGITGGIGSGKSFIAQLLRDEFGVPIYDCDTEAKRLNNEDPLIREKLIQAVGPQVYQDGTLVKPVLAAYLFASEEHAEEVNAIIHPAVHRDFLAWQDQQKANLVGLESAILFESGFHRFVDYTLFVDAPLELRIQRVMQRDGTTRELIEQRISRQRSPLFISQADYIIQNDGAEKKILKQQLARIINKIKKEHRQKSML